MQGDTELDLTWPREEPYTPRGGGERKRGTWRASPPTLRSSRDTLPVFTGLLLSSRQRYSKKHACACKHTHTHNYQRFRSVLGTVQPQTAHHQVIIKRTTLLYLEPCISLLFLSYLADCIIAPIEVLLLKRLNAI